MMTTPSAAHPLWEELQGLSNAELLQYVTSLRQEALFLSDEVLIKNQTITAMANALKTNRQRLNEARAGQADVEGRLKRAMEEISSLRLAQIDAAPRTAELETVKIKLEEEVKSLSATLADQGSRLGNTSKLEEENTKLKTELQQMNDNMADWRAKVKEALKENRKKEQAHEKTEIELRTQLNSVKEQLDRATFELQAFRAKEAKVRSHVDTQTDDVLLEPLLIPMFQEKMMEAMQGNGAPLPGGTFPFSPLSVNGRSASLAGITTPPLPVRSQSKAPGTGTAGTEAGGGTTGKGEGEDLTSPPPKAPNPAPRFIVAVHFGSQEGWTVDTKHVVNPGMTVSELIRNCCATINARYAQKLDETQLCLKLNHGKAKRLVTLSDQRELHSFAVFHKYQKDGIPIVLTLDHKRDEPWDEFLSPRFHDI